LAVGKTSIGESRLTFGDSVPFGFGSRWATSFEPAMVVFACAGGEAGSAARREQPLTMFALKTTTNPNATVDERIMCFLLEECGRHDPFCKIVKEAPAQINHRNTVEN
jgi:hypothetical protein